jgi:uncharacterized phage protein (TIGR01671 family)
MKEMTGSPLAIKFRGICVLEGEFFGMWVYGDLLQKQGKTYICPHANSVQVNGHIGKLLIMHEVHPETVGQYTQLNDRNSKEIYRGDILLTNAGGDIFHDIVTWGESDGVWLFESTQGICTIRWDDIGEFTPEVIGNVYENPELFAH